MYLKSAAGSVGLPTVRAVVASLYSLGLRTIYAWHCSLSYTNSDNEQVTHRDECRCKVVRNRLRSNAASRHSEGMLGIDDCDGPTAVSTRRAGCAPGLPAS